MGVEWSPGFPTGLECESEGRDGQEDVAKDGSFHGVGGRRLVGVTAEASAGDDDVLREGPNEDGDEERAEGKHKESAKAGSSWNEKEDASEDFQPGEGYAC